MQKDAPTPQVPSEAEINAERVPYREAFHKNRNNMAASMQIARHLHRAAETMQEAANEMVQEIRKNRGRLW